MKNILLKNTEITYKIFGEGSIDIVIEGALNSCQAEWWDFCNSITGHTVLVYDRAGYGYSKESPLARTPENIVYELEELLNNLNVSNKITIIAHSQGALYASLYTIRNPDRVRKLILLDPLSFTNHRFKTELTAEEYYSSGVDKSKSLKIGKAICSIKLGFIFKPLIKQAPPFFYKGFDKLTEKHILKALTNAKQYKTAINEYENSQHISNLSVFKGVCHNKVTVILHNSIKMKDEIMYYGGTDDKTANKIELLWISIMKDYNQLFSNISYLEAINSCHYIHLTDRELVQNEI